MCFLNLSMEIGQGCLGTCVALDGLVYRIQETHIENTHKLFAYALRFMKSRNVTFKSQSVI